LPYRHLGAAVLGMLVVGSILLGELAPPTAKQQYERTAALAAASLSDDDAGQALFTTAQLLPGSVVTNCLFVEYAGPPTLATVRVGVYDLAGPLAHNLTIRIAQGTGGHFGDCAGFTGKPIYDGPLADLAASHPAPVPSVPGIQTAWNPRAGEGQTYQVTVTVATNVAQGLSCTATMRWELVDETPDASAAVAVPTPTGTTAEPESAPDQVHGKGSAFDVAKAVGVGVVTVARLTARHSGLIGGWLVVLVLFMAVQNRIDARDPKLALAPLVPEPYLYFSEPDPDGVVP
jgi:hypothetical protein